MASISAYFTAVGMTFLTAYPFYGMVSHLRNLDVEELTPCTEQPCIFSKYLDGDAVPGTYPDFVQVQNVVPRPIIITSDFSTVMPVLWNRRVPKEETVSFGHIFGGVIWQWPELGSSMSNIGLYSIASVRCFFGICVDGKRSFSIGPWSISSQYIAEARSNVSFALKHDKVVQDYLKVHDHQLSKVESLKAANERLRPWQITQIWFDFLRRFVSIYQDFIVEWNGNNLLSGSEHVLSGLCDSVISKGVQSAAEHCASAEIKGQVRNPFKTQLCVDAFLVSMLIWTTGKMLHDVLLLADVVEETTLTIGLLTLPFQMFAAGSSLFVVLGASQVLVAPLDGPHCACYYKLNDFVLLPLMLTPGLLIYNAICKRKAVALSLSDGDYLYYKQYDVPHALVKHIPEDSRTLLVPAGNVQNNPRKSAGHDISLSFLASVSLSVFALVGLIGFPAMICFSFVFPRFMGILVTFIVPEFSIMQLILRVVVASPSMFVIIATARTIGGWISRPWGRVTQVFFVFTHSYAYFLLPPLAVILGRTTSTSEDIHVLTHYWAIGGALLGLDCIFELMIQMGAVPAKNADKVANESEIAMGSEMVNQAPEPPASGAVENHPLLHEP